MFLPRRVHPDQGFTLTELLVTMAVVAALLTLLLPTVRQFRAQSLDALCKTRLKNIGTAHLNYVTDNNGVFIPAAQTYNGYWYEYLAPYFGKQTVQWVNNVYGGTVSQVPAWLECPAKKGQVGYGWNQLFGNYVYMRSTGLDVGPNTFRKLTQVTKPANTILHGDSKDLEVESELGYEHHYLYRNNIFRTRIAKRHAGKGNYVFVDGHVETLSPDEILKKPEIFEVEQ